MKRHFYPFNLFIYFIFNYNFTLEIGFGALHLLHCDFPSYKISLQVSIRRDKLFVTCIVYTKVGSLCATKLPKL